MRIEDTIFAEDNAFLNLIDIIENGRENFVLATELPEVCLPAKMEIKTDGRFCISFKMPKNQSEQMSSDFCFTHHSLLISKGIKILIQNKDIRHFSQVIEHDKDGVETKIEIISFRADTNNYLWNNSKQMAFCSYSEKEYNPYKAGVIFDLTSSQNQANPWKNGIKLEIEGCFYLLYFVTTNNQRNFIVFKSQNEVNHETFLEILDSIRIAIGLLSGYYIADTVWYMSMKPHIRESITFRYEKIGESIYNEHPLLDCNLYEDCCEQERKLSSTQFERLVLLLYKNKELRNASLILTQAGNINGVTKGCLAAVALETIKSKITHDKIKNTNLIADKEVKKQLRYELLKGLKKIKDKISKELYKRLESKLAQIDQPSNSERLEAPFDALGITLSKDEAFCLSCRNNFLHGASIKANGELYKHLNQQELINIISNRLIMLTAMLILKKCGYSGKVVDWGYTEVAKWRAIHAKQSIKGYGNAFRDLKESNNQVDINI